MMMAIPIPPLMRLIVRTSNWGEAGFSIFSMVNSKLSY